MTEAQETTPLALIAGGVRRHRRDLAIGYPLILAWQLCEMLVPVAIGLVIDRGVETGAGRDFVLSLLVLAALFAILSNGYRFGARFIVRAVETESHLLRTRIAAHVLRPEGARTTMLSGETLSLATSDATLVPHVLHHLGFTIAALLSVVAVAVYLIGVDVLLGLMILVGVPLVLLAIQLVTPLVARRTQHQQERTAVASGLATDLVTGLRPLKGIGGEAAAMRRYRAASTDAGAATIGLARSYGYLAGLTTLLSMLLLAGVTWVAGTRALDGDITLGELIALVGLTQFLAEPIAMLGEMSAQFAGSRASARRICAFLATPPLVAEGDALPAGSPPPIVLRDVAAGALAGVSLETTEGELLAVVADDPAAADALTDLLTGTLAPSAGTVSLGGAELATLALAARRRAMIVDDHHGSIFEGTLRSAVDPDGALTPARLEEVLRASAADEVVALHPDGLERSIRAEASSLSGGQRQRLALARALATDAPVLVLADPTSAVDAVTEQVVAAGLAELRRRPGRTTVVLTSSPAILQQADRVLLLTGGVLTAEGRHADLLHRDDYRAVVLR